MSPTAAVTNCGEYFKMPGPPTTTVSSAARVEGMEEAKESKATADERKVNNMFASEGRRLRRIRER